MTAAHLPILYTFRRCPYAMRARLALLASGVAWEHREVVLRHKPAHLLSLSPKGTVPVLYLREQQGGLPKGQVLAESLDIMLWALRQHDPLTWLPSSEQAWLDAMACIAHNDGPFKQQLDRFKYPNRYGLSSGLHERDKAAPWLQSLDARLQAQPFLAGRHWGLSDAAIAPFVRQFAHTDPAWFADQAWGFLAHWLNAFESSELFLSSMQKHAAWTAP